MSVAVEEAVSARFQTLFWADYPALPVEFSGLEVGGLPMLTSALAAEARPLPDQSDPSGTSWVRETMAPVSKEAATFFDDRETWLVFYDVFTPWGSGRGWNSSICDAIEGYFNRVQAADLIYISTDGLGPSRTNLGRTEDGWLHQRVRVPVQYFGAAGEAQIVASPMITQVAHGLSALDVIGLSAASYAKAQAGTIAPIGVVDAAPTVDTFRATFSGLMAAASHGFTLGADLYLSNDTAGLLTETEPTAAGERAQIVARAVTVDQLSIDIEGWEDI